MCLPCACRGGSRRNERPGAQSAQLGSCVAEKGIDASELLFCFGSRNQLWNTHLVSNDVLLRDLDRSFNQVLYAVSSRTLEGLSFAIPKVSRQTLSSLLQIPSSQIDAGSISQIEISPEQKAASEALRSQLHFLQQTDSGFKTIKEIHISSGSGLDIRVEPLVPYRLLPDDGGVEMRGQYICEYRSASEEFLADVAHCQKLLLDLPVGLTRSRTALDALLASPDADLSEVGAMTVEQKRIQQEIDAQTKKLAELQSADKKMFTQHKVQTSVTLQFGVNQLCGRTIQVMRAFTATPHIVDLCAAGPPGGLSS